jgi:hypothetical protein
VTTITRSGNSSMIHPPHPIEHQCVMTGFTIIDGVYVAGILAHRGYIIMALGTGAGNAAVVKPGRNHSDGGMAIITGIGCVEMICRLANRDRTVMTTKAVSWRPLE